MTVTALVQRNHWWVVNGSGNPTQVPSETVSTSPLSLVPETVGDAVANGGLFTAAVEVVNLTTDPRELVAVIRATKYLPTSALAAIRVLAVAPLIAKQPAAAVSEAEATSESHLNHWYV